MPKITTSKRARTGQIVAPDSVRSHCVSVRLDDAELAQMDAKRGNYRRGEWMRMAAFDSIPLSVPEANLDLSLSLAKLLGAMGSLMQNNKLDHHKEFTMLEIRAEVVKLRKTLEGNKS